MNVQVYPGSKGFSSRQPVNPTDIMSIKAIMSDFVISIRFMYKSVEKNEV